MQPTAEKFTEKAWAAIVSAQQLALQRKQQQLETEHLFLSLLDQNGLAGRILEKAGVLIGNLQTDLEAHLQKQPTLQAAPESVYVGKGINLLLDQAEQHKEAFGDSFISIEHLLLALAKDNRCGRQLLSQAGVDAGKLKVAIDAVRGNKR